MHITREADYAVRSVLYLAINPGSVIIVDDIAREMDIPKSFLAKIIQKLSRKGLVKSTRGVKGGFRLAQKPEDISLLHVIEAVQGPLSLNTCLLDKRSCTRISVCSVHPVWMEIQEMIEKKLKSYNFKSFVENEREAKEKKKKKRTS